MSGFTSPNHTQTPNDLFDVHMLDMSEAELKVTLAIIRKTLGYHKKSDPISLTQLQKLTGLSRQGVSDGSAAAINRGIVEVVGTGKRGIIIYGLVINSDQSIDDTSNSLDQSKILDSTGLQNRHTKETTPKEKKKKKSVITPSKKIDGWSKENDLIQAWAKIRNLDAVAIGAPLETPTRQKCARRMLKWLRPITTDDIADAIKVTKSNDYEFTWLENDVPKRRGLRANAPQVISDQTLEVLPKPVEPTDDLISDERVEEGKRLMAAVMEKTNANTKPYNWRDHLPPGFNLDKEAV